MPKPSPQLVAQLEARLVQFQSDFDDPFPSAFQPGSVGVADVWRHHRDGVVGPVCPAQRLAENDTAEEKAEKAAANKRGLFKRMFRKKG